MPIQITELNISVSVNNAGKQESSTQPSQDAVHENSIDDCTEQIMKILNDKKER